MDLWFGRGMLAVVLVAVLLVLVGGGREAGEGGRRESGWYKEFVCDLRKGEDILGICLHFIFMLVA